MLCAWLSFYGAALYGSARVDPSTVPDVETVLADSLKLSRQKAVVARRCPSHSGNRASSSTWIACAARLSARGQTRVLGFFLDLTAKLSG